MADPIYDECIVKAKPDETSKLKRIKIKLFCDEIKYTIRVHTTYELRFIRYT